MWVLSSTATHLNGECLQRYLKGMCELNCDYREGTKNLPSNLYMYLSIYQNFFSGHVALDEGRPKFGPFKVSCWIFDMPIDEKCTFGYGVIRDRCIECNWRKNVHFSAVEQELTTIALQDFLLLERWAKSLSQNIFVDSQPHSFCSSSNPKHLCISLRTNGLMKWLAPSTEQPSSVVARPRRLRRWKCVNIMRWILDF